MSPEETKFEETQYLVGWLYALTLGASLLLVAGVITIAVGEGSLATPVAALPLLGVLLLGCIFLLLLRMRTTVYGDRIVVQFGWTKLVRFTIPLSEVKSCRAVTYRPLREFGGWGIRRDWGGRRANTMRGNRASEVVTTKRTILIGSAEPDQLSAADNSLLSGPAPAAPGGR
jgi:hypothetical protein